MTRATEQPPTDVEETWMSERTGERVDPAVMTLEQLRHYRRLLVGEEDRVSYWRRVVQARIDVLEGQAGTAESLTVDQLSRALGDTATGRSRRVLSRIEEGSPLPELPVLERFWQVAPEPEESGRWLDELRDAERQLTEYRRALHDRLDAATRHLVELYRENPGAALDLLP